MESHDHLPAAPNQVQEHKMKQPLAKISDLIESLCQDRNITLSITWCMNEYEIVCSGCKGPFDNPKDFEFTVTGSDLRKALNKAFDECDK